MASGRELTINDRAEIKTLTAYTDLLANILKIIDVFPTLVTVGIFGFKDREHFDNQPTERKKNMLFLQTLIEKMENGIAPTSKDKDKHDKWSAFDVFIEALDRSGGYGNIGTEMQEQLEEEIDRLREEDEDDSIHPTQESMPASS